MFVSYHTFSLKTVKRIKMKKSYVRYRLSVRSRTKINKALLLESPEINPIRILNGENFFKILLTLHQ
jgi:hypothetical protein